MASIQNFFIKLFLKVVVDKKRQVGMPVVVTRKSLEKLSGMAKLPKGVKYEKVEFDGIAAEWSIPDNLKNPGVILYLHGGGYVAGSIRTHRGTTGRLAHASKTKCLSVEYSLAPEKPFPAGLDDAIKAYHWLLKQGFDNKKIVISGDSAGGGLAVATMLRLRNENAPQPAAGVLMSPWLDLECTGESALTLANADPMVVPEALREMGLFYTSKDKLRDSLVSPLYADLKGLPPMFIQASSSEVLYDDTTRFEKKLKEAGVQVDVEIWKKMVHVWQAYAPILPEAMKAIEKLGLYIENKTK